MDIDSRVSERNSGLKMSYRTSRNRTMCHYLLFRVFAKKSKGPMKLLTFVQKRKLKCFGHILISSGLAKTILQETTKKSEMDRRDVEEH